MAARMWSGTHRFDGFEHFEEDEQGDNGVAIVRQLGEGATDE